MRKDGMGARVKSFSLILSISCLVDLLIGFFLGAVVVGRTPYFPCSSKCSTVLPLLHKKKKAHPVS